MAEMVFQAFGGLRGAVGIALAVFLDNTVKEAAESNEIAETKKVFGFVGGIAFMTLVINATVAGPFLKKLGLADTSEIRKKLLVCLNHKRRLMMIDDMVRLLAEPRFRYVHFGVVREHVQMLNDLTLEEFQEAVQRFEDANKHKEDYQAPHTSCVVPYLQGEDAPLETARNDSDNLVPDEDPSSAAMVPGRLENAKSMLMHAGTTSRMLGSDLGVVELRGIFIELLRSAYGHQIRNGELKDRGFVAFALDQSLEFASDDVQKGRALDDWDYVNVVDIPLSQTVGNLISKVLCIDRLTRLVIGTNVDAEYGVTRVHVERTIAFLYAHKTAQRYLMANLTSSTEFSGAQRQVMEESQSGFDRARKFLRTIPVEDLRAVVSHKFADVLLNNSASYVEHMVEGGILKHQEAEALIEEIQNDIDNLASCDLRSAVKGHAGKST